MSYFQPWGTHGGALDHSEGINRKGWGRRAVGSEGSSAFRAGGRALGASATTLRKDGATGRDGPSRGYDSDRRRQEGEDVAPEALP